MALKAGVNINSLELFGYKVNNFHLKLNDKFVIQASKISKNSKNITKKNKLKPNNIEKTESKKDIFSNIAHLEGYLNRVIKLSNFFEYISLESINLHNQKYILSFSDGGILYIAGGLFEFAGKIIKYKDHFKINYPLLFLKRFNLRVKGYLNYYPKESNITLFGEYKLANIDGNYRVNLDKNIINFELNSSEANSLRSVLDLFRMNFVTKEWLYNRIKAKRYKLISLNGSLKIENGRVFPLFDTFKAKVKLTDLNVTFHSKLPPISAKEALITLKNQNLYFKFKEPKYQGRLISGSKVALLNIFNRKKLTLNLYIVYTGVMDKTIIHILNTYKVPVAIRQEGGDSFGILRMSIPLQRGKRATYYSKVTLKGGDLIFKNSRYKIKSGNIEVDGKVIKLQKMHLKWQNLVGVVNGELNLAKQRGDFNLFVKSFYLPLGMGYIKIKNKKLPIVVTWAKGYKLINIPSMKTKIKIKKQGFEIDTKRLSLWKKYLGGFLALFDGGVVKITTKNLNSYSIAGDLYWKSCPLCKKEASRKTNLKWSFRAKATKSSIFVSTKTKSIVYNSKKRLLIINNLDIDTKLLQKMLKQLEQKNRTISKQLNKKQKIESFNNLKIIGKNSTILYPDYRVSCQKFTLENKKELKYFSCYQDSYKIDAVFDKAGLKSVTSKEIDSVALDKIFNFHPIQNTRYKIDILRVGNNTFRGIILIKGGVIKRIKNFDKGGFKLKNGKLIFNLEKNILKFKTILLEGDSATVAGEGVVDMDTKDLNLNLAVQTARELGKAMGNIPIVGYIIFGDDKSFTVGVKVTGTLDKPDIKTSPVGDAFAYPLQLLKRVIKAPSKIK